MSGAATPFPRSVGQVSAGPQVSPAVSSASTVHSNSCVGGEFENPRVMFVNSWDLGMGERISFE